jgi:hypothetical protein
MKVLSAIALACTALGGAMTVHAGGEPLPTRPLAPAARAPEAAVAAQGTPVPLASVPREVRRAVAAAAAGQLKVSPNDIVLTRVEQVTWSDGSLGCPQPGLMYTQMLVPGYRVSVRHREQEAVFHTDARGASVGCGRFGAPRGPAPAPTPAPGSGHADPRTAPRPAPTPDR